MKIYVHHFTGTSREPDSRTEFDVERVPLKGEWVNIDGYLFEVDGIETNLNTGKIYVGITGQGITT